jgi:pilus assembly protein Flp/PilA
MIRFIGRLLTETRGGTAIEYGFILALVVLALMAALVAFAGASFDIWSNVSDKVISASS